MDQRTEGSIQIWSLSVLSARTLTALEAGLALNIMSSPVKGFRPLRALVAGFFFTVIFMPMVTDYFTANALQAIVPESESIMAAASRKTRHAHEI